MQSKADEYGLERVKASKLFSDVRRELNKRADQLSVREPLHPMPVARELARAIGKTPIVDEALATTTHLRQFLDNDHSRQYSMNRGGALGWGMPAAIGFSLGLGREPVVSIVGDGAAMYSPQCLWTAAYEKLPVTFIVINNTEYNILKNFMRSQPEYESAQTGKFIAMDLVEPPIDFQALATSMGIASKRITRLNDINEVVTSSIRSGRPSLIEIVVGIETEA